jgi:DNA-binding transcriptional ArsR family regulator
MKAMTRSKARHDDLSPELTALVAERFRILGDPIRIHLLQELQSGEKNVSELVAAVGSTQPNVSKHLRILQDAGIVGRRQEGNNVYCFIADSGVFELCDAVCSSLRARLAAQSDVIAELERRGRR